MNNDNINEYIKITLNKFSDPEIRLDEDYFINIFYQIFKSVKKLKDKKKSITSLNPKSIHLKIKYENNKIKSIELNYFKFEKLIKYKKYKKHKARKLPLFFFSAPEVNKNIKYNPFISDIWSLGITLYLSITGSYPFDGISNEYLKNLHTGNVNLNYIQTFYSENLSDLLSKMLEVDVDKRITIEEILLHNWFEVYIINKFGQQQ
jgi:serine/threonine protein kinase